MDRIIAFAGCLALAAVAHGGTLYVSPDGSDDNPGTSEAPLKNIKPTIAAANAAIEGGETEMTINVAPGTYNISDDPATVANPITIVGLGTAPGDVVLRGDGWWSGTPGDHRVAILDNAEAALYNVTLENGFICNWGDQASVYGNLVGANVSILAGVVSNCVIQAGRGEGFSALTAGAYLGGPNALLTHSIVRNNNYTTAEQSWGALQTGGGIRIANGRVENCVIYGNTVNDTLHNGSAGGVRAFGGVIANCTIYNNSGYHVGGVHLSDNAQAYNLAIIGNIGRNGDERPLAPWGGTGGNFHNCATDGETAINDSCVTIDATAFRDFDGGVLTPKAFGPLHNAGADVTLSAETDFAGRPRVKGRHIDIGAYECQGQGLTVFIR